MGAVGVTEVEPDGAGGHEHSGELMHDRAEAVDPGIDGGLQSELSGVLVVAQTEVRRAGDNTIHTGVLQFSQSAGGVADQDGVSGLVW